MCPGIGPVLVRPGPRFVGLRGENWKKKKGVIAHLSSFNHVKVFGTQTIFFMIFSCFFSIEPAGVKAEDEKSILNIFEKSHFLNRTPILITQPFNLTKSLKN